MIVTPDKYIEYFRRVAEIHPLIRHDRKAELPDGKVGAKRFTIFSMDDIARNTRSAIATSPVLHLHMYDIRPRGEGYDFKLKHAAGFLVTMEVPEGDIVGQQYAYTTCQQIVMDIINLLRGDRFQDAAENRWEFGNILWNESEINATGAILASRYGYFVQFPFETNATNALPEQSLLPPSSNQIDHIYLAPADSFQTIRTATAGVIRENHLFAGDEGFYRIPIVPIDYAPQPGSIEPFQFQVPGTFSTLGKLANLLYRPEAIILAPDQMGSYVQLGSEDHPAQPTVTHTPPANREGGLFNVIVQHEESFIYSGAVWRAGLNETGLLWSGYGPSGQLKSSILNPINFNG